MKKQAFSRLTLIALLALLALLSACAPQNSQYQATLDALTRRIAQTETASAPSAGSSAGGPTTAVSALATVEAQATQVNVAQTATQAAQSAQDSAAVQGTRAANRPVLAELPLYGVDPDKGQVAWIQPPLTLQAVGFNAFKADNAFPGTVVKDFVLSANITWNTLYGDSGCGFVVRSDGDQLKPSMYLIVMTRLASGHIIFSVISKGKIANAQDIFPRTADSRFSAENDTTNELTVVGRGSSFQVYTNRSLVANVDPNKPPRLPQLPPALPPLPVGTLVPQQLATFDAAQAQRQQELANIQAQYNQQLQNASTANKIFPQGFVSMVVVTQSGKATCTFQNAWLFLMEG